MRLIVEQNPHLIDPSELLRPELDFAEKSLSQFRDYSINDDDPIKKRVQETYRKMHLNQTVDFVKGENLKTQLIHTLFCHLITLFTTIIHRRNNVVIISFTSMTANFDLWTRVSLIKFFLNVTNDGHKKLKKKTITLTNRIM